MVCKSAIVTFLALLLINEANSQVQFLRVVGGQPTNINLYPILAQLLLDPWGSQQFEQYCAGVILTSRHVLSAAHCFQYNANTGRNYTLPKYWKIRVGTSYRNRGGVVHDLTTIVPHPAFDHRYYISDISVVVVARRFAFNGVIGQGTIAKRFSELQDGSQCTLVGWGSTESNGPQSDQLQYTTMNSINQDECRRRYDTIGAQVLGSMLCAGKLDVGGADGCSGDSGGPLIYKGVVVGLVSFGYDCGHRYYPGVYTKVSHYTDWIVSTISNIK